MIKLDKKLKMKLTGLGVELIDCGIKNKIKLIKDLGIYVLQVSAEYEINDKIIKAIFELVGIAKSFERRSEIRNE